MKKLFTLLFLVCATISANAYVVAGEEAIGLTWNVESYEMSDTDEDGIYTYTVTNVEVSTPTALQWKLFPTKGSWDNGITTGQEWDGNSLLPICTAGTYDITFYYDTTNSICWADAKMQNPTKSITINVQDSYQPYIYLYTNNNGFPAYDANDDKLKYLWFWGSAAGYKMGNRTTDEAGRVWWSITLYNYDELAAILTNGSWGTAGSSNQSANLYPTDNVYYLYDHNGTATELTTPYLMGLSGDWTTGTSFLLDDDGNYTLTTAVTTSWQEMKIKSGSNWFSQKDASSEAYTVTSKNDFILDNTASLQNFKLTYCGTYTFTVSPYFDKMNIDGPFDGSDVLANLSVSESDAETVTYNNVTKTMTVTEGWKGGSWWNDTYPLSGSYLVVKTESDCKLKLRAVTASDGSTEVSDYDTDETTLHVLSLEGESNVYGINIQPTEAGTVVFTECYVTSAATIAAPAESTQYLTYGNLSDAVSFAGIEGIEVSTVTYDAVVGCTRKHDVASKEVPANTAVVLFKETGFSGTLTLPVLKAAAPLGDNDLKVSDGNIHGAEGIFCLSNGQKGIGFYPVADGVQVPANKAYLQLDLGTQPAPAYVWFNGDTTGIDALENGEATAEKAGAIYTLDGRRVNGNLSQGLYIQNGKKFVVK